MSDEKNERRRVAIDRLVFAALEWARTDTEPVNLARRDLLRAVQELNYVNRRPLGERVGETVRYAGILVRVERVTRELSTGQDNGVLLSILDGVLSGKQLLVACDDYPEDP